MYKYPFSSDEARAAHDEWGFNCGPAALSFALQVPIDHVRRALPDFEERGYTNPTMMAAALASFHRAYFAVPSPKRSFPGCMFDGPMTLVRVQFTGPWTLNGTMKWASTHTHWMCCWRYTNVNAVFDINGGILPFNEWEAKVLPKMVAEINRADGGWYPANVWRFR